MHSLLKHGTGPVLRLLRVGSWVLIRRVTSALNGVIIFVTILLALLNISHEPPSPTP